MRTALKGRTHGCTDQACDAKILLANPEPSTHGTLRQFAATQHFGRFWGEADIEKLTAPVTEPDL
jgi:hypothetical protein